MSVAALEALLREQRALIAALDADDAPAIEAANAAVDQALLRVRASPTRPTPEMKALAEEATRLADAARVRINVLADMTERRLTRLAAASGRGDAAPTYGRNARWKRG
ncbi:hypothetical protein [Sphingomonas morindae]|uniref:Flagellar protein FlgN n=1 Tax=Sphingomonas morindae TaxID=1541170 RepID=A0ABY4XAH2_9SPHN|nr:hypothetical protein [Sphingomonas morindae]USI73731.1 hypothetical protein LHA26_04475 [Sphingomonas morindae]